VADYGEGSRFNGHVSYSSTFDLTTTLLHYRRHTRSLNSLSRESWARWPIQNHSIHCFTWL